MIRNFLTVRDLMVIPEGHPNWLSGAYLMNNSNSKFGTLYAQHNHKNCYTISILSHFHASGGIFFNAHLYGRPHIKIAWLKIRARCLNASGSPQARYVCTIRAE
jgi:hypothetical protein